MAEDSSLPQPIDPHRSQTTQAKHKDRQEDDGGNATEEFSKFFSKDQLKSLEKCFQEADKDCDNFLNATELKYWMEKHGKPISHREFRCILQETDLDHDGLINFKEFLLLCHKIGINKLLKEELRGPNPLHATELKGVIHFFENRSQYDLPEKDDNYQHRLEEVYGSPQTCPRLENIFDSDKSRSSETSPEPHKKKINYDQEPDDCNPDPPSNCSEGEANSQSNHAVFEECNCCKCNSVRNSSQDIKISKRKEIAHPSKQEKNVKNPTRKFQNDPKSHKIDYGHSKSGQNEESQRTYTLTDYPHYESQRNYHSNNTHHWQTKNSQHRATNNHAKDFSGEEDENFHKCVCPPEGQSKWRTTSEKHYREADSVPQGHGKGYNNEKHSAKYNLPNHFQEYPRNSQEGCESDGENYDTKRNYGKHFTNENSQRYPVNMQEGYESDDENYGHHKSRNSGENRAQDLHQNQHQREAGYRGYKINQDNCDGCENAYCLPEVIKKSEAVHKKFHPSEKSQKYPRGENLKKASQQSVHQNSKHYYEDNTGNSTRLNHILDYDANADEYFDQEYQSNSTKIEPKNSDQDFCIENPDDCKYCLEGSKRRPGLPQRKHLNHQESHKSHNEQQYKRIASVNNSNNKQEPTNDPKYYRRNYTIDHGFDSPRSPLQLYQTKENRHSLPKGPPRTQNHNEHDPMYKIPANLHTQPSKQYNNEIIRGRNNGGPDENTATTNSREKEKTQIKHTIENFLQRKYNLSPPIHKSGESQQIQDNHGFNNRRNDGYSNQMHKNSRQPVVHETTKQSQPVIDEIEQTSTHQNLHSHVDYSFNSNERHQEYKSKQSRTMPVRPARDKEGDRTNTNEIRHHPQDNSLNAKQTRQEYKSADTQKQSRRDSAPPIQDQGEQTISLTAGQSRVDYELWKNESIKNDARRHAISDIKHSSTSDENDEVDDDTRYYDEMVNNSHPVRRTSKYEQHKHNSAKFERKNRENSMEDVHQYFYNDSDDKGELESNDPNRTYDKTHHGSAGMDNSENNNFLEKKRSNELERQPEYHDLSVLDNIEHGLHVEEVENAKNYKLQHSRSPTKQTHHRNSNDEGAMRAEAEWNGSDHNQRLKNAHHTGKRRSTIEDGHGIAGMEKWDPTNPHQYFNEEQICSSQSRQHRGSHEEGQRIAATEQRENHTVVRHKSRDSRDNNGLTQKRRSTIEDGHGIAGMEKWQGHPLRRYSQEERAHNNATGRTRRSTIEDGHGIAGMEKWEHGNMQNERRNSNEDKYTHNNTTGQRRSSEGHGIAGMEKWEEHKIRRNSREDHINSSSKRRNTIEDGHGIAGMEKWENHNRTNLQEDHVHNNTSGGRRRSTIEDEHGIVRMEKWEEHQLKRNSYDENANNNTNKTGKRRSTKDGIAEMENWQEHQVQRNSLDQHAHNNSPVKRRSTIEDGHGLAGMEQWENKVHKEQRNSQDEHPYKNSSGKRRSTIEDGHGIAGMEKWEEHQLRRNSKEEPDRYSPTAGKRRSTIEDGHGIAGMEKWDEHQVRRNSHEDHVNSTGKRRSTIEDGYGVCGMEKWDERIVSNSNEKSPHNNTTGKRRSTVEDGHGIAGMEKWEEHQVRRSSREQPAPYSTNSGNRRNEDGHGIAGMEKWDSQNKRNSKEQDYQGQNNTTTGKRHSNTERGHGTATIEKWENEIPKERRNSQEKHEHNYTTGGGGRRRSSIEDGHGIAGMEKWEKHQFKRNSNEEHTQYNTTGKRRSTVKDGHGIAGMEKWEEHQLRRNSQDDNAQKTTSGKRRSNIENGYGISSDLHHRRNSKGDHNVHTDNIANKRRNTIEETGVCGRPSKNPSQVHRNERARSAEGLGDYSSSSKRRDSNDRDQNLRIQQNTTGPNDEHVRNPTVNTKRRSTIEDGHGIAGMEKWENNKVTQERKGADHNRKSSKEAVEKEHQIAAVRSYAQVVTEGEHVVVEPGNGHKSGNANAEKKRVSGEAAVDLCRSVQKTQKRD